MGSRLSDEHLTAIYNLDHSKHRDRSIASIEEVRSLLAEIRERRAADLTDVDCAALKYFVADTRALRGHIPAGGYTEHALAVLDRLLNGGE